MKKIAIIAAAIAALGTFGCAAAPAPCPHTANTVSIDGNDPLCVRIEAGAVWASSHEWRENRRAWATPASGAVTDIAIEALPHGDGHLVTFRQGGAMWRGELDQSRHARGPLQMLPEPFEGTDPGTRVASH